MFSQIQIKIHWPDNGNNSDVHTKKAYTQFSAVKYYFPINDFIKY
jgi:hypothetical protein